MSPIYVRPAREQHEHDRLIRFLQRQLQAKHKKKLEITINPGDEQTTAVKVGPTTLYPDLVLAEGKALAGIVEVETGESVNNLEAMHQWVPFSRTKVPFHLYVPVLGYDTTKRLMQAYQARATEIWTYRPANDGFDLVRMHTDPAAVGAGRSLKAVLVAVAPKPVAPPPPPEPPPPPPPPKPAVELKSPKGAVAATGSAKGAKAPLVAALSKAAPPPPAPKPGARAIAGPATPPAKTVAPKPAAAKAAPAPTKLPAKPAKAVVKPVKPAAKPAAKSAAPAKVSAKAAPTKQAAAKSVVKPAAKKAPAKAAAKPSKAKKKPSSSSNGKKRGSAGKKGR